MKPYPLAALNHLTLPSGITNLLLRKQPRSGCRVFSERANCPAKATLHRPVDWSSCKRRARWRGKTAEEEKNGDKISRIACRPSFECLLVTGCRTGEWLLRREVPVE